MQELQQNYEIVFVNDGSKDQSKAILGRLSQQDHHLRIINFSRNFGHQAAISAGMDHARGKAIVVIDADLQDPPEVIPHMIQKWQEGYQVVYGKRKKRAGETFFKKITAKMYYRLLAYLTDIDIPMDTGDFRLIDRKVCDALKQLPEKNRYVRGLISWLGFRQTAVEFSRASRFAGETKYPLRKMLKFATDGITSFSAKPLKLATVSGSVVSGLSFLYLTYVFYLKLFTDATIKGWTSLIAVNLFFFGFILVILGIFGEYIGRIYNESQNRPLYVVDELMEQKEYHLNDAI
jgi:glycosyltransferase involved in cell wall biosynthesis